MSKTVTDTAINHITDKLKLLGNQENVRLLFAVESGSRAWGFPSPDSDYDVRFVYARRAKDYLAIHSPRDVIETPIMPDDRLGVPFDMSGWDVRKAIGLALKTNRALIEWLSSPIVYFADTQSTDKIRRFAATVANMEALSYHHYSHGAYIWQDMARDTETAPIKNYCYALRAAISIAWISYHHALPPMNLQEMMIGINLSADMKASINHLVATKAVKDEKNTIPRSSALDSFLCDMLGRPMARPPLNRITPHHLDAANQLFREIIGA